MINTLKSINTWHSLLNIIAFHYKKSSSYINIIISSQLIDILQILQDNGYIHTYYNHTKGETCDCTIYLKYFRSQPAWQTLLIYSKPSHQIFVSHRDLINTVKKTSPSKSLTLIATSTGVISLSEAVSRKLGGILLAKLQ
jgi:ribosomal protein S8